MSLPWGRGRSGPADGVRATLCLRCYLDYTLLCPRVKSLGLRCMLSVLGGLLLVLPRTFWKYVPKLIWLSMAWKAKRGSTFIVWLSFMLCYMSIHVMNKKKTWNLNLTWRKYGYRIYTAANYKSWISHLINRLALAPPHASLSRLTPYARRKALLVVPT